MQFTRGGQPLDGLDSALFQLGDPHEARPSGTVIDEHSAGATVSLRTPILGTHQTADFSQILEKGGVRLDVRLAA
jgi:hypothetical protein